MNSPTQRVAKDRPPVGWSFADMVFAIVAAAATVFLLGMVFSLALRLLGFTGVRAYVRTNLVIFCAAAGTAVYSTLLAAIYLRIIRRRNVSWKAIGFRRPPLLPLLLTPFIILG